MEYNMADDQNNTTGSETGGSLRQKLETALEANASLTSTLVSYKAKEIIQSKGLKHVTPEDFAGVKLDEIEAKADELEATKAADAERVLKSVLAGKGLEGADLDKALAELLGTSQQTKDAESRISRIGRIGGERPGSAAEQSLVGPDKIRAAIEKRHSKKK